WSKIAGRKELHPHALCSAGAYVEAYRADEVRGVEGIPHIGDVRSCCTRWCNTGHVRCGSGAGNCARTTSAWRYDVDELCICALVVERWAGHIGLEVPHHKVAGTIIFMKDHYVHDLAVIEGAQI